MVMPGMFGSADRVLPDFITSVVDCHVSDTSLMYVTMAARRIRSILVIWKKG